MPSQHVIDESLRLITTAWSGVAVDNELIDALKKYQREIRSRYNSYNEILDLRQVTSFELTSRGIKALAQIASHADAPDVRTKLAIIVDTNLAFGLGRMYEAYRHSVPGSAKEVRIFRNCLDAFEWIEG